MVWNFVSAWANYNSFTRHVHQVIKRIGLLQKPQLRAFRYVGHTAPVQSVAFSPDGALVASASKDHTGRVSNRIDY
jgi:WD40 repeat protein